MPGDVFAEGRVVVGGEDRGDRGDVRERFDALMDREPEHGGGADHVRLEEVLVRQRVVDERAVVNDEIDLGLDLLEKAIESSL